ncbi:MAG: hypothetical protein QW063_02520 [Candidatus Nanoarchaeia archaeon]
MMRCRAQVSIIYMLITISIAFILASSGFLFSKIFKESASGDVATAGLECIAQLLEKTLLDLKQISNTTNASSINITIKIPYRIGEQKYFVSGLGDEIELRTIGNPSSTKVLKVAFWQNVSIKGTVDSNKGSIVLTLRNSTLVLLQ